VGATATAAIGAEWRVRGPEALATAMAARVGATSASMGEHY
jgi:hypothetical protein